MLGYVCRSFTILANAQAPDMSQARSDAADSSSVISGVIANSTAPPQGGIFSKKNQLMRAGDVIFISLERKEARMQDAIWVAVTIAFFAASIAYVHFCERVK